MKSTDDFVILPNKIYADDPYYIPQDGNKVAWQLSDDNPEYAKTQVFIECDPGKARLAGFYRPDQIVEGKRSAFFGFWETMNDKEHCRKMFAKFESWAKEQGAERIFGPIDFNTYGKNRVRFPNKKILQPFTKEPYNPPYYPELLENCGYSVFNRYISFFARRMFFLGLMKLHNLKSRAPSFIEFRPLTAELWMQRIEEIYPLLHEIFKDNFAYQKIERKVFDANISTYVARILDPNLSILLIDTRNNRAAGICIALPDYSEITRQGHASPIPEDAISWEEHHSLLHKPRILGKTLGVLPEYRKLGLHNRMVEYVAVRGKGQGDLVGCLARVGNHSIISNLAIKEPVSYGLYVKGV